MNQSILLKEVKHIELIESPMPERKPGEALLKVLTGGICGTDLSSYRGYFAYFDFPRVVGHEFAAEIVEIDENEYGLKKGMRVACNPYFNCKKCYPCTHGNVNCCEHNETMGVQREGAFSNYITMPLERIYDGKGLDAHKLALVEPFCISLHGVSRADIRPGEKVLVVGAGTIGVFAAKAAMLKGGEVTICDVSRQKLDIAKGLGIEHTLLNDDPETFMDKVNTITDSNGFDVTIEAVGLPSTFQNCLDAVCFHGRVVLIGVSKRNIDLFFTIIQKKELAVYGSRNALKEDFLYTIDKLASGELDIDKAVTSVYPLKDAAQAFADFDAHQGENLKVLIDFE